MAKEQLAEGVSVAGDMGCQQLGVTAFVLVVNPKAHGRTVTVGISGGTSPEGGM